MKKMLTVAALAAAIMSGCSFTQSNAGVIEADTDRIREAVINELTPEQIELMELSSKNIEVHNRFAASVNDDNLETLTLSELDGSEDVYEVAVPGTASADKGHLTLYISPHDYKVIGKGQDDKKDMLYDATNTAYEHLEDWQQELVPFSLITPFSETEEVVFKGNPAIKVTFEDSARRTHGNLIAYVSMDEKYLLHTEFDGNIQK